MFLDSRSIVSRSSIAEPSALRSRRTRAHVMPRA
jgi:hypothetical protein